MSQKTDDLRERHRKAVEAERKLYAQLKASEGADEEKRLERQAELLARGATQKELDENA